MNFLKLLLMPIVIANCFHVAQSEIKIINVLDQEIPKNSPWKLRDPAAIPLLRDVGVNASETEVPIPGCKDAMKIRMKLKRHIKPMRRAMRKYIRRHCKLEKAKRKKGGHQLEKKLATLANIVDRQKAKATRKSRRFNVYAGFLSPSTMPKSNKAIFLTAVQCLMGLAGEEIKDVQDDTKTKKAREYRDSHPGCFDHTGSWRPGIEPVDFTLPPIVEFNLTETVIGVEMSGSSSFEIEDSDEWLDTDDY